MAKSNIPKYRSGWSGGLIQKCKNDLTHESQLTM